MVREEGAEQSGARLWIKIDLGSRGQIGPGKIRLLQAVESEGSISAAARAMGMSYRRAWLLVDALNTTCGRPVVETRIGGPDRGGAHLTPLGKELVALYRSVTAKAGEAAGGRLDELLGRIAPDSAQPPEAAGRTEKP